MSAPVWVESIVGEFGRAAGLRELAFNGGDTAALRFENGFTLRFEYAPSVLAVALTVPARLDPGTAQRILSYAHPLARQGRPRRATWLSRASAALFAVLLAEREVTLPALNAAFADLWRVGTEFGGAP